MRDAPYKMPEVGVGPCLWRLSPTDPDWAPAVVTAVGDDTVDLTVFAPENRGNIPKSGVRHVDDPYWRQHPWSDAGCWDYTPLERRVRALERAMAEVAGRPAAPAARPR